MSYRNPKIIDDKSGLIVPNAIAQGAATLAKGVVDWGTIDRQVKEDLENEDALSRARDNKALLALDEKKKKLGESNSSIQNKKLREQITKYQYDKLSEIDDAEVERETATPQRKLELSDEIERLNGQLTKTGDLVTNLGVLGQNARKTMESSTGSTATEAWSSTNAQGFGGLLTGGDGEIDFVLDEESNEMVLISSGKFADSDDAWDYKVSLNNASNANFRLTYDIKNVGNTASKNLRTELSDESGTGINGDLITDDEEIKENIVIKNTEKEDKSITTRTTLLKPVNSEKVNAIISQNSADATEDIYSNLNLDSQKRSIELLGVPYERWEKLNSSKNKDDQKTARKIIYDAVNKKTIGEIEGGKSNLVYRDRNIEGSEETEKVWYQQNKKSSVSTVKPGEDGAVKELSFTQKQKEKYKADVMKEYDAVEGIIDLNINNIGVSVTSKIKVGNSLKDITNISMDGTIVSVSTGAQDEMGTVIVKDYNLTNRTDFLNFYMDTKFYALGSSAGPLAAGQLYNKLNK